VRQIERGDHAERRCRPVPLSPILGARTSGQSVAEAGGGGGTAGCTWVRSHRPEILVRPGPNPVEAKIIFGLMGLWIFSQGKPRRRHAGAEILTSTSQLLIRDGKESLNFGLLVFERDRTIVVVEAFVKYGCRPSEV